LWPGYFFKNRDQTRGEVMNKSILLVLIALCLILSIKHAFSTDVTKKTGKIDPKKALSKDEYSLYKSAYLGRAGKVKRLVDNGVNVNIHSPNSQRTPLHIAASKGRIEIVKTLVENGADLELRNLDGKTPLHSAVECSRAEVIRYLHSKGAKITEDMLNIAGANIKTILTSLK
jgi:ankyrin repeat protein